MTGPIIIAIGLNLSKSAIDNCAAGWWIAVIAIVIVIVCNIWGKGMVKIVPIILGVVGSYLIAAITGNVDFLNFFIDTGVRCCTISLWDTRKRRKIRWPKMPGKSTR